ncbi:hypothetical protein ACOBR2_18195 [Telmatobacter bradus]|uniref:hypothetical protein n=1 Tax=Telmatobacter bradus TaxID=474953 RepID=UPI003B42BCDC
MNFRLTTAAAAIVAASLVATYANAGETDPTPAKKPTVSKKSKASAAPSVEEQIKALRQELESQINSLKGSLADKDTQLKQAQQSAADAQAAAAKAQDAATAQQKAVTENAAAVSTLQSTVTDMKGANASAVASITDEASAIKKTIASPDVIHYKGITLSPAGSFVAAETSWRSAAVSSDVNTPFTSIPLAHSENGQISEFYGSARQSRIALRATGKLDNVTMTGYYEVDWLGAGVTSNNNQSNSYVMRQRQIWLGAKFNNGWDFTAGQGWSLAAETSQGLNRTTEVLPGTIDAAYTPGFVWTRQWGARVTKNIGKKVFAGMSLENPETLNVAGQNLPTNESVYATGTTGGLYNSGNNYSYNLAPDMIVKIAAEPGWGHWEAFGIGRLFRDRIYPTTGSGYNSNPEVGAGIGGGFRGPLFQKKVTVSLKGLYGQGVGRYGDSTIADVTLRPNSTLLPLHGFSSLATIEVNPTPKLNIYTNYGGDYIGRAWRQSGSSEVGYGTKSVVMSGCNTENAATSTATSISVAPTNCSANTKDVQAFVAGYWYTFHNSSKGRFRQGIQYSLVRRDLWSGATSTTNPGGSANGYDHMLFTSFRYYLP